MQIKQYKLFITLSTLFLVACQSSLNTEKMEQQSILNILSEMDTNSIFQDGNNSQQVDGKNVLFKLDHGCQLDRIFNYPNNKSVTYRYIFENEKLISATTIIPDERNPKKIGSTWNDPEYEPTVENFKQAKKSFSEEHLHKCS